MNKVKIGILGLGRIGKIHLQNIVTKIDNAEVVAAMNPSLEGQAFARKFNVQNHICPRRLKKQPMFSPV